MGPSPLTEVQINGILLKVEEILPSAPIEMLGIIRVWLKKARVIPLEYNYIQFESDFLYQVKAIRNNL